jgi:hypothetical protein
LTQVISEELPELRRIIASATEWNEAAAGLVAAVQEAGT